MRNNCRKMIAFFLALAVGGGIIAYSGSSQAMPGFARKYRFSCQVCHSPFPRLKPYGDEFAGNGFRLPEGEPERAYRDVGDPLLLMPRDIPLGFRFDGYFSHEPDLEESDNDMKTPYNLKVISGGPITDYASYYFYFFYSERGEVAGVEDAFLFFSDVGGSGINVTVGQFAVSDPIYKNELRISYEPYQLFALHPERSNADFKYDRGIVVDYSFDFGLDVVAQAVNGNGIMDADGRTRSFDQDDDKNYMFRLNQQLGPIRLGGFYYTGMEQNTDPADDKTFRYNHIQYYGGDMTIGNDNIELNTLYLVRKDSNPHFLGDEEDSLGQGLMVELIFSPEGDESRWYLSALYNDFDSDYEVNGIDTLDYQTATVSLNFVLARNVRILTEYTYIIRDMSKGENYYMDESRYVAGVVAAF